mmetsp:Transcript_8627/g.18300  ORF Transcript_8627/g.18300 Transcript_8627/m.18300 type:complete len:362 (-) Transcript_8627:2679-3764(-)
MACPYHKPIASLGDPDFSSASDDMSCISCCRIPCSFSSWPTELNRPPASSSSPQMELTSLSRATSPKSPTEELTSLKAPLERRREDDSWSRLEPMPLERPSLSRRRLELSSHSSSSLSACPTALNVSYVSDSAESDSASDNRGTCSPGTVSSSRSQPNKSPSPLDSVLVAVAVTAFLSPILAIDLALFSRRKLGMSLCSSATFSLPWSLSPMPLPGILVIKSGGTFHSPAPGLFEAMEGTSLGNQSRLGRLSASYVFRLARRCCMLTLLLLPLCSVLCATIADICALPMLRRMGTFELVRACMARMTLVERSPLSSANTSSSADLFMPSSEAKRSDASRSDLIAFEATSPRPCSVRRRRSI